MRARILITGGNGQLAADLRHAFEDGEVWAPGRTDLDIISPVQIEAVIERFRPDIIINTAAFHRVDLCETEPEQSFLVNAAAPQRLAAACRTHSIHFVHYSTDYVFDGTLSVPYPEDHPVAPLSVYGSSKAAGEMAIRCTTDDYLIIRTTGLFGLAGLRTGHGNFVETMIRLGSTREVTTVVCDQVLTPSSTVDVARYTRLLLDRDASGIAHVTNSGHCSWYEFAAEIFRLQALPGRIEPVPQEEYTAPARRPAWSVLDHGTIRQTGLPEPESWHKSLEEYLRRRDLNVRQS